jgi:hypothetical protein
VGRPTPRSGSGKLEKIGGAGSSNLKAETSNWKLAAEKSGNWKPETGSWELGTGNWELETGNWKLQLFFLEAGSFLLTVT